MLPISPTKLVGVDFASLLCELILGKFICNVVRVACELQPLWSAHIYIHTDNCNTRMHVYIHIQCVVLCVYTVLWCHTVCPCTNCDHSFSVRN